MKKVLLSLLLFSCYGLQSANAADEKIVYLRLSNGSEFTINNSLAQALRTIHDQLEYLGDTAQEDPLQIPKDSVTADVLTLFKDLNQESITTKEQVSERIAPLSLLELIYLYNADDFLHFTKEFTKEFNKESFSAILFEKIIEVLITTEDVNGVASALAPLDQLPNIAKYFKAELYKRAHWVLLHTLKGHANFIRSVAFSPDGQLIATALNDGTAKLWNPQTGQILRTFQGHTEGVSSVAFSPDGQLIATASDDNTAKVWDAQTGQCLRTLEGHTGSVTSVAFSPDGLLIVTGSDDRTAKIWNPQTGQLLRTLQGHTGYVRSVAFSPNGKLIVTGSWDRAAKLWNAQTGELLHTLQGHNRIVRSVAFSPDGKLVATASNDGTVKLWNTLTGELLHTLQGHTGWISSVAFSPDGQSIATALLDCTIKIWINNFLKAGITTLGQALQLSILDVLHVFKTGESIQSARRKWRKEYDFIRSIGDTKVIDFQPNQNKTSLDDVD